MSNPDFFMKHPLALEQIELHSSPEGTISLAKKQQQRLQDKSRQLQEQLQALIENAHTNSTLQAKVHQLCLDLMDAHDLEQLLKTASEQMQAQFSADEVCFSLFFGNDANFVLPNDMPNVKQFHPDDKSLTDLDGLIGKQNPVCGRLTAKQKSILFAEAGDKVQSVVCLPLGHEPCAGLVAIGSYEPSRFHADMATDYLSYLGDVFMRCLKKFCHH